MHLFWKRIALFNMFIRNIHVSLCSINLCLENGPRKKCIWKRICQIHQIRWIKYKYKYKYMVWNLIKYKYKYKYAVFVFVFVFVNTNTYLTPALVLPDNHHNIIIPPAHRSWRGYTGFILSVYRIVSALYFHNIAESISYSHILSSDFRRCVVCNVLFKIKKFEVLANSLNL